MLIEHTGTIDPALRTADAMRHSRTEGVLERRRIYVISSYRCDGSCLFCLIRHDHCFEVDLRGAIEQACQQAPSSVSVSITGGEPLLDADRVRSIAEAVAAAKELRWVGIATNGFKTRRLDWVRELGMPVHIYLSVHSHDPGRCAHLMGRPQAPVKELTEHYRQQGAEVMLSCTMTRSAFTSPEAYCQLAADAGISKVCFRELTRCSPGAYHELGAAYSAWRERELVGIEDVSATLSASRAFDFEQQTVRPYIYHEYWRHRATGVNVVLRRVDEVELADWAGKDDTETVIYPDGSVSCGWNHSKEERHGDE